MPVFFAIARELLFLVPGLAAVGLLAHAHLELQANLWKLGLFVLGFLLLPAYALGRLLLRTGSGFMERVCLGYPAAQALLFLTAWGGSRLGLSWWATLALPALGLYSIWDLSRQPRGDNHSDAFAAMAGPAAATVVLAIFCIGSIKLNPLPISGMPVGYYSDDGLMTMGSFSALKAILSGGHFIDGRFGDLPATYHILLFVQNAMAHLFSGVHMLFLQLYCMPVLNLAMLGSCIAVGARRLAGFGRWQTALVLTLLLFTSGWDFIANGWLQIFFYYHTFTASLLAALMLGFTLFGVLHEKGGRLPVTYTVLAFLAASAAKSVVMLQVPLALLPVLAYRLFKRRIGRDDLLFSVGVLVTGLVLRAIEYRSTGQLVFKKFNLFNTAMDIIVPGAELLPYAALLLVLANQGRLAAFKVGLHRQYLIFCTALFALAVVLTRSIEFVGGGQYFYWYSRYYLLIGVAGALDWAFARRLRPVLVATVLVVLAGVGGFTIAAGGFYRDAKSYTALDVTMDRGEWDGLMWANRNLEGTARFVCNRFEFIETRKGHDIHRPYYDYLAVSGLYGYAWIFEWLDEPTAREINRRLEKVRAVWSAKDSEAQAGALRKLPVEYLFVSKRQTPYDFTAVEGISRVYSNPTFDIYDIRGVAGAHPQGSGGQ